MKKILVFGICCCFLQTFYAQSPAFSTIKVQVDGLKASRATLGYFIGDQLYLADSTTVDTTTGNLVFQTAHLQPGMFFVAIPEGRLFDFMLEHTPADLEVRGWMNHLDSLIALNSPENTAFFTYQHYYATQQAKLGQMRSMYDLIRQATNDRSVLAEQEEKMKAVSVDMAAFETNFISQYPDLLFTKMLRAARPVEPPNDIPLRLSNGQINSQYLHWMARHFWDNNDFNDPRLFRNNLWTNLLNNYLTQYTAPQPDSICIAIDRVVAKMPKDSAFYQFAVQYLTQRFELSGWPPADRVFVHLVDTYQHPKTTPWLDQATLLRLEYKAAIHRANLTGNPAPPLELTDRYGKLLRLDTIKAPYTLLIFYSPLCAHCQEQIPGIYDVFRGLESQGLRALAVNTDDKYENWRDYARLQNRHWYDVADPSGKNDFEKPYAAFNLPVIYLLDKDKKILRKRIPAAQLKEVLDPYFKK